MSQWPSKKARIVLKALMKIGWSIKRQDERKGNKLCH